MPLTADELDHVRARLADVIEPYAVRLTDPSQRPDGARIVRVLLAGTPERSIAERREA